jgi:hypothetical protein
MLARAIFLLGATAGAQAAVSLEHKEIAHMPAVGERFNEYVVLDGHDTPNDYELPRPQDYATYVVCGTFYSISPHLVASHN